MTQEALTLQDTAALYGLSARSLRRYLRHEEHPLTHHRVGRAIRIERHDAARWFASFKDTEEDERTVRRAQFKRDFPQ